MFQTASDVSIKDNNNQKNPKNKSQPFSLPLIPIKPSSRGETLRRQNSKVQKIALPNIKQNQAPSNSNYEADDKKEVNEKQNKNTFAREVQEKLKLVLGGMQANRTEEEVVESYDSDDFDFEAQINKNKQLIKQHKIKKEIQANINIHNQNQKIKNPKIPKPIKHRNQSLYEKRAKEYKQNSVENKYLSKRKQTLKEKNNVRQSSKDIKFRNQLGLQKDQKERAQPIRRSKSKANNRVLSHKSSAKNLKQVNKSVNLFDGIQNYLENPREKRDDHKEQLIGLSLLKAKRDIEDKIKAINEHLGYAEEDSLLNFKKMPKENESTHESSMKEWRRVEFKEKELVCQDSNFDKQLDRVNSLQQRNALSLQKYLQYQKMLLQLEIHNKSASYRKQVSSSQ